MGRGCRTRNLRSLLSGFCSHHAATGTLGRWSLSAEKQFIHLHLSVSHDDNVLTSYLLARHMDGDSRSFVTPGANSKHEECSALL